MFIVKFTYYVVRKVLRKVVHSDTNRHKVWKIIWKAKVIPKVKFFSWRLIHGILPVCARLLKKWIQVEDICSVCGREGETVSHIFLDCRLNKEVCVSCYLEVMQIRENVWDNIEECDQFFQWLHDKDLVEIWLNLCLLIWNNKNHCFHNHSCRRPFEIVRLAGPMKKDISQPRWGYRFLLQQLIQPECLHSLVSSS